MALLPLGHFKELRHGDSNGPSLTACRRTVGEADEQHIAEYLARGNLLALAPCHVADVLDEADPFRVTLKSLTDGVWNWYSDLPHYLTKYHVELPPAFLNRVRRNDYIPPVLSEAEFASLSSQAREV